MDVEVGKVRVVVISMTMTTTIRRGMWGSDKGGYHL